MVAKVKGPFVWHKHDDTDDFFLVLKGELDIELRGPHRDAAAGRVVRGAERRRASPGGARGGSSCC
jgi:quercetin dioxygenase-like cupin family protein